MKRSKYCVPLVLSYFLIPFVVSGILSVCLGWSGLSRGKYIVEAIVVWLIFGAMLLLLSLCVVAKLVYRLAQKRLPSRLEAQRFTAHQTFTSSNAVVCIDFQQGKVAITYFFNPHQIYIMEAGTLNDIYTDDGISGAGLFKGTSRVRFCFTLDGEQFKIPTFLSNKRWTPEDKRVQEGISKADRMVELLTAAKERSLARQGNS